MLLVYFPSQINQYWLHNIKMPGVRSSVYASIAVLFDQREIWNDFIPFCIS